MDPSGDESETKAAKPVKGNGYEVKKGRASPNADSEDPPPFPDSFDDFTDLPAADSSLQLPFVNTSIKEKPSSAEMTSVKIDELEELHMPLHPPVLEVFLAVPLTSSPKGSKDYGEEPPHLSYGFEEFSQVSCSSLTKESSRESEGSLDSITRTGSPKRVLAEDNAVELQVSVKRARDTSSIEKSTALEVRQLDEHVDEEDVYPVTVTRIGSPKRTSTEQHADDAKRPKMVEAITIDSPLERRLASTLKDAFANLRRREASMNKREITMDKREASMDKREASMDKREPSTANLKDSSPDSRSTSVKDTDGGADAKTKALLQIKKGADFVQEADNTASLAEKIVNIPKRGEALTKLYKENKSVLSQKARGVLGSITTVGVINLAKGSIKDLLGIEDAVTIEEGTTQAGVSDKGEPEPEAVLSKEEVAEAVSDQMAAPTETLRNEKSSTPVEGVESEEAKTIASGEAAIVKKK